MRSPGTSYLLPIRLELNWSQTTSMPLISIYQQRPNAAHRSRAQQHPTSPGSLSEYAALSWLYTSCPNKEWTLQCLPSATYRSSFSSFRASIKRRVNERPHAGVSGPGRTSANVLTVRYQTFYTTLTAIVHPLKISPSPPQ